jgi:ankyrin repeat protein
VVASLLSYHARVAPKIAWKVPEGRARWPNRNPLHLLCSDRTDVTDEMIRALVTVEPTAAIIEDGYGFRAVQLLLERQGERYVDAAKLTPMLRTLADADPEGLLRPELPTMADSANYKHFSHQIGLRCGRSCMHMICERHDVSADMINALVQGNPGAVCAALDDRGRTPLHVLCENEAINETALRALLEADARANGSPIAAGVPDKSGMTPLQTLCLNKRIALETVTLLVLVNPGAANCAAQGHFGCNANPNSACSCPGRARRTQLAGLRWEDAAALHV